MSGFVAALSWVIFAAWVGYDVGRRHGSRDELALWAPAILFTARAIEGAKQIKRNRLYIGEGAVIQNVGQWTLGDIGKFKVTLEEACDE